VTEQPVQTLGTCDVITDLQPPHAFAHIQLAHTHLDLSGQMRRAGELVAHILAHVWPEPDLVTIKRRLTDSPEPQVDVVLDYTSNPSGLDCLQVALGTGRLLTESNPRPGSIGHWEILRTLEGVWGGVNFVASSAYEVGPVLRRDTQR
jgi:hypothetical protein